MRDTTIPMTPEVRAFAKVTRSNGDVEIVEIDDVEIIDQPDPAETREK